jgi:hypothetical protein
MQDIQFARGLQVADLPEKWFVVKEHPNQSLRKQL